ncbi:MAG: DUF512 domain-containing protein [Clostridia bacterium]|nr:DUF512 domain-containing protein [Clostridia bacterium]
MLKILFVDPYSVGAEIGLEAGDAITHFNNEPVVDILDYEYFEGQEEFSLGILAKTGENVVVDIEKDVDETLGLTFEDKCYLTPRACRNKCIFCFVDQLPKGMRKSLYFKDDDWRMSFAAGSYVTFTNLTESEINRICTKKFSPLYVSVHATDDVVRRNMLQNQTASSILPLMQKFGDSGVNMHTQIVLCPDVNDKQILQKSLDDLFNMYPKVQTLSVVPVGLTKYRNGLKDLKMVDKQIACEVLDMVEAFAEKCYQKTGTHFVYCSDEFYITAERQIPSYEYYENFAQIENGVGMLAKFKREFDEGVQVFLRAKNKKFTLATGDSAFDFISELTNTLKEKFGLKADVIQIKNQFFGESVTVSGLLTAPDILYTLESQNVGDVLLLPRSLLRETEDVFLDGMTLDEFKKKVGKKVEIVENDGFDFCAHMLEGDF